MVGLSVASQALAAWADGKDEEGILDAALSAVTPSDSVNNGTIVVPGGVGVTGNINAGALYSDNYFFANGNPITTGGGGAILLPSSNIVDGYNHYCKNITLSSPSDIQLISTFSSVYIELSIIKGNS